jgi:hypothetical protein
VLPRSIPITCIGGDGKVSASWTWRLQREERGEERKEKIYSKISQKPGIPEAGACQNLFLFLLWILGRLK